MLHTVLIILSIIGIVLACILAIIILLLLLVIFVAIHYKVKAIYHHNEYSIIIRASWLLGFIKLQLTVEKDKIQNKILILGIQILKKKKDPKKIKEKVKKEVNEEAHNIVHSQEVNDSQVNEDDLEISLNLKEEKTEKFNTDKKKRYKIKKNKKSIFLGVKEKIKKVFNNIKNIIEFLKDENNKEVFIFTKLRFFELLNHIKPKKIEGEIEIGFEDPANTGLILGLLGVVFGFIGTGLRITPYFDKSIIDVNITLKGRIRVFNMLKIVWKCYRNKKLKKSFRQLMSLMD